jgi:hypothetical protein
VQRFWTLQNIEISSFPPPQPTLLAIAINISRNENYVETSYSNELDESACEALCPVIEDCAATVIALKSILDKVAISWNDPG